MSDHTGDAIRHALIISGGSAPPLLALHDLLRVGPEPSTTIAVDSGYDHARALGLQPDMLIGDLDSISADGLRHAEQTGVRIDRHPAAKDATDLELALDHAKELGVGSVTVVSGGVGTRVDHFLAELNLLCAPHYGPMHIDAWLGNTYARVIRADDHVELHLAIHTTVTLLPITDLVDGITTTGFLYPLTNEPLHRHSTRGVSNQTTSPTPTLTHTNGTLLLLIPNLLETTHPR